MTGHRTRRRRACAGSRRPRRPAPGDLRATGSPLTRFSPGRAVGCRPRRPRGARRRRSVTSESVAGSSASTSRTMPSPPRCAARAAGAATQLVAAHAQRVLQLERLDRRVERVGHADVDAGVPGPARPGALAAADRLVVRPAVAAEHDVVHRALALRRQRPRACASAASTVSAMRWLVSMLPATTADGRRALTREPSGARDRRAARTRPALVGMSAGSSTRSANRQAERVTRDRAVDVAGDRRRVPAKSTRARRRRSRRARGSGCRRRRRRRPPARPRRGSAPSGSSAHRGARAPLGVGDEPRRRRPRTTSRPRRSTSSASRSWASRFAASCARRSPRRMSGRAHVGQDQVEHVGHDARRRARAAPAG